MPGLAEHRVAGALLAGWFERTVVSGNLGWETPVPKARQRAVGDPEPLLAVSSRLPQLGPARPVLG